MIEITREEALRRWHEAKRIKHEAVERSIKILSEEYEREYGVKPKNFEVW